MTAAANDGKREVGEAAAALVQGGTTVGLGTGSTAAFFVRALGARAKAEALELTCVSTSRATAALAEECGLRVVDLDAASNGIDLTIDGADEITRSDLAIIKGGGAALLREKLVWEASRRCVAIVDASKAVARLGAFPLPVEVVAFGHATTARRIASAVRALGYDAQPRLRMAAGAPLQTDGGGLIYDLPLGAIDDAPALAAALKGLTGVVEHGLFLGLAAEALVGGPEGVRRLAPGGSQAH